MRRQYPSVLVSIASSLLSLLNGFSSSYATFELDVDTTRGNGFTALSVAETGVSFENHLNLERALENQHLLSGSGVGACDVDADGDVDLYFCRLDGPNELYLNEGDFRFRLKEPGPEGCKNQDSTGVLFMDYDADGSPDLFVTALNAPTRAFRNNGAGTFTETTDTIGLTSRLAGMSMAAGDIDGDGDLDLYVTHYRPVTLRDEPGTKFRIQTVAGKNTIQSVNGVPANTPQLAGRFTLSAGGAIREHGQVDEFYLNSDGEFLPLDFGTGLFRKHSGAPAPLPYDWGLAVAFRDINQDGLPDLYICNDLESPDRIWLNSGENYFKAPSHDCFREISLFSMGVDFADLDRDGLDDFYVADMRSRDLIRRHIQTLRARSEALLLGDTDKQTQHMRSTLHWNKGMGYYSEIGRLSGVDATDWSWTPAFIDVDLDGLEDLLVTNGQARDFQDLDTAMEIEKQTVAQALSPVEKHRLNRLFPSFETKNVAFKNLGGMQFEDKSSNWGFDQLGISQGMALADLDNDGDADLVLNNLNAPASLYRNNAAGDRLKIQLRGRPGNSRGAGARVSVNSRSLTQSQEMMIGGRYLSCDQPSRTFAALDGDDDTYQVEIKWRSGTVDSIDGVKANSFLIIKESSLDLKIPRLKDETTATSPWFQPSTVAIPQPPLALPSLYFHLTSPQRTLFPSVAASTSLLLSGAKERAPSLMVGGSSSLPLAKFTDLSLGRPRMRSLQLPTRTGSWTDLARISPSQAVAVSACAGENGSALVFFDLFSGAASEIVPLEGYPYRLAVYPKGTDRTPELFVLTLPPDGQWTTGSGVLKVSQKQLHWGVTRLNGTRPQGAVFSDIVITDWFGDGQAHAILSEAWGDITRYKVEGDRLQRQDSLLPKERNVGLWRSLAIGDFNGDGRPDLAAGNRGLNSELGNLNQIEAKICVPIVTEAAQTVFEFIRRHDDVAYSPLQTRFFWSQAFPAVEHVFPTLASFGESTPEKLLDSIAPPTISHTLKELRSLLIMNLPEGPFSKALPLAVQVAPVNQFLVEDFNRDGCLDLLCLQNEIDGNPRLPSERAGLSVVCRGLGDGLFSPLDANESGLAIGGQAARASYLTWTDGQDEAKAILAIQESRGPVRLYQQRINAQE